MDLQKFNEMSADQCQEWLTRCCGSKQWAEQMLARRPFQDEKALFQSSNDVWNALSEADWLEAFSHHPKIGDLESLKKKFLATADLAGTEQSGVQKADEKMLQELQDLNEKYVQKFGFIFIICATGKGADEMLKELKARIANDRKTEITLAAAEQAKITRLRLEKL